GTIAAFSACNATPTREVMLNQTQEGLGFNILGGKEQNTSIFISKIIAGGIAEQSSSLMRGDKLLMINNQSIELMKHESVVELLKSCKGNRKKLLYLDTVHLIVKYCPDELQKIEKQFGLNRKDNK
ncbi:hypothetical protein HZS_2357, partial [Henneguya salminicola]